jgi:murein DD-endopeptidase MepM/ murein hydrolase activator NlpD
MADVAPPPRFWPLGVGRVVTSPYGPRSGGFHYGTDFGRDGGCAGMPIYACQGGIVQFAGEAQGYGGPDPAGWIVIDHPKEDGSGCTEYGHLIREVNVGQRVEAGQRIAYINPDQGSNGGVSPHLHMSVMPHAYDSGAKIDPVAWLGGAREPEQEDEDCTQGPGTPPPPDHGAS